MATVPRSTPNLSDFPTRPRKSRALQEAHQLRDLYQRYEEAKDFLRDIHRELSRGQGLTEDNERIREQYARAILRCEQLLANPLTDALDDVLWQARTAIAEETKLTERVKRELASQRSKRGWQTAQRRRRATAAD